MAMSTFRLNADMGQLSAMVIFIALVVDFVFLPALLMRFDTASYAQENQSQTSDATSTQPTTAPQTQS